MSVATVVGMVVALPGQKDTASYLEQNLEKTFHFPEVKDHEGCFNIKMLMLDGYNFLFDELRRSFDLKVVRSTWQDKRILWTKELIGFAKVPECAGIDGGPEFNKNCSCSSTKTF